MRKGQIPRLNRDSEEAAKACSLHCKALAQGVLMIPCVWAVPPLWPRGTNWNIPCGGWLVFFTIRQLRRGQLEGQQRRF